MAKVKVQIAKCYEVWTEDENGELQNYQYVYGSRKEAEEVARVMKQETKEALEEEEAYEAEKEEW